MHFDYTVIDFETANSKRTSACSIGITVVQGFKYASKSWLIKPEPDYFLPINVGIHGIRPEDVKTAPTFAQLWPHIEKYFNADYVIAHNLSFDISVLRRTLEFYGMEPPSINGVCSIKLAKKALPGMDNYKLSTMADHIGVKFKHHDAEEDCRVTAKLVMHLMKQTGTFTIKELCDHLTVYPGILGPGDRYQPCR